MEHGSLHDQSNATFSLADEDHTLANALRFTLNQEFVFFFLSISFIYLCSFKYYIVVGIEFTTSYLCISLFELFFVCLCVLSDDTLVTLWCYICSPRVVVSGYSIPHPSEARVNIRVQTTGKASEFFFSPSLLEKTILALIS